MTVIQELGIDQIRVQPLNGNRHEHAVHSNGHEKQTSLADQQKQHLIEKGVKVDDEKVTPQTIALASAILTIGGADEQSVSLAQRIVGLPKVIEEKKGVIMSGIDAMVNPWKRMSQGEIEAQEHIIALLHGNKGMLNQALSGKK